MPAIWSSFLQRILETQLKFSQTWSWYVREFVNMQCPKYLVKISSLHGLITQYYTVCLPHRAQPTAYTYNTCWYKERMYLGSLTVPNAMFYQIEIVKLYWRSYQQNECTYFLSAQSSVETKIPAEMLVWFFVWVFLRLSSFLIISGDVALALSLSYCSGEFLVRTIRDALVYKYLWDMELCFSIIQRNINTSKREHAKWQSTK